MSLYLLDSCVLIDVLRGREDRVAGVRRLVEGGGSLACCDVVVVEVLGGMRRSERDATMDLVDSLEYLVLSSAGAIRAGEWRTAFRQKGVTLSTADCIIAAVADEHSATLVTGNVAHYPEPGLNLMPADGLTPP